MHLQGEVCLFLQAGSPSASDRAKGEANCKAKDVVFCTWSSRNVVASGLIPPQAFVCSVEFSLRLREFPPPALQQHACILFFRKDEVELVDFHQYEDNQPGDEDAFAREPFILRFRCPTAGLSATERSHFDLHLSCIYTFLCPRVTAVKDLVLIPVHTKPEDSMKELDELDDVVQHVRKMWKTNVGPV